MTDGSSLIMNNFRAQESASNFSVLKEMDQDHMAGPSIYHASEHWKKLNELNTEWLVDEGLDNFKRTVNNNYFNWMVDLKSVYFQRVAKSFFRSLINSPGKALLILRASIGEMYRRTYASHAGWFFQEKDLRCLYSFSPRICNENR